MPTQDSSHDYDLLDRLVEEFNERYRKGERPSVKEYCERYPQLADDLREVLPALAQVEGAREDMADRPESPQAPASPQAPPAVWNLGDFRILREVGRGGMGIVYEAEQVSLGRRVALKVLTDRLLRDPRQLRRFEREARAAGKLHHTNIVPVFGTGSHDGTPYFVMQFIQGMGLDAVIEELVRMGPSSSAAQAASPLPAAGAREVSRLAQSLMTGEFHPSAEEPGPDGTSPHVAPAEETPPSAAAPARADTSGSTSVNLPGLSGSSTGGKSRRLTYWQSVARLGAQVADALEHAHKQGIIHRDIKPSNLLLDLQGTVWVTDFGLAKAEGENLTHTGDVLGTLRYMPPEAFEARADLRGDLYALGLTLYELVALRPAFDEQDRNRLVKQVTTATPEPLGRVRRGVPRDLETIIGKATDRDPAARYQSAAELRDDLQRFVDDEPIRARRQSRWESARRWARHNPAVASLLALIALLLVGVTAASVAAAAHFDRLARSEAQAAGDERKAREDAESAKKEAEASEKKAREARDQEATLRKDAEAARKLAGTTLNMARAAADDYLTRVSENQWLQAPGLEELRKEVLLSALGFYKQLLKDRVDDPSIRAALGEAHLRVGKILAELGSPDRPEAYVQARRYFQVLQEAEPENVEYQHGLAQAWFGLGRYDDAIALWSKLVRPELPRFQAELAGAHAAKATGFGQAGKITEALAAHQEAQAIQERLITLAPDNPQYRRDLGATLNNIGILLSRNSNRGGEALLMYRRAAERLREAYARTPNDYKTGRFLAIVLGNVASQLRHTGGDDEALKVSAESVELWRKLASEHPNVPELHAMLYTRSLELSRYQAQLGRTEESEQSLFQARAGLSRLPREGAENLFRLACVHALTADALAKGKPPAPEAERRKEADLALDYLKKAVAAGLRTPSSLSGNQDLRAIKDRSDFTELVAEMEARAATERARSAAIAGLQAAIQEATATTLSPTATAEEKEAAQGKLRDLRAELARTQSGYDARVDRATSKQAVGLVELDRGNVEEAAKLLREAVALREEMLKQFPTRPLYQADLVSARMALAKLHWATGQKPEAMRTWEKGLADLESLAGMPPGSRDLLGRWAGESLAVARLYFQMGLVDEAAAHYARVFGKYQPVEMTEWRTHGLLRLLAGDTQGHRKACDEIARRFTIQPNTAEGHDLTTLWSMAPPAGSHDPEMMSRYSLAFSQADPATSWKRFYHGLVLYRSGKFEEARRWVEYNWPQGLPVRAMIAHRLGQADEARKWLAETEARYRQELRANLRDPARTFLLEAASNYQDCMQFLILRNEARLLIEGKPAGPDELISLCKARGYAQIGDAAKADAAFAAAVRIRPDDPETWEMRGRVYSDLDRVSEAAADRVQARKRADTLLAGKFPDDIVASLAAYLEASPAGAGWVPLRPSSARSETKGALVVRRDGSVEPAGPHAGDDTCTLIVPTEWSGLTALRLDVLPTDGKAGQAGAVRLADLSLTAAPLGGGEATPVRVSRVVGAPKLTAGDGAGWSALLDPAHLHSVVVFPEKPVGGADGTILTIRLRLHGPKEAAAMGRFRLSATRVTGIPLKALETPGEAGEVVRGRFVRIELPGSQRTLHLAEVEVMSGGQNVARGRQATQSSTSMGGSASRAVDGNRSGKWGANSMTHTEVESNPWWEVDLGAEVLIDHIGIYNRTDTEQTTQRLAGYTLRVLDAHRKVVFEAANQPAPPVVATHEVRGSDAFPLPGVDSEPDLHRISAGPAHDRAILAAALARSGRPAEAAAMFGRALKAADTEAPAWPVYRYAMTFEPVFRELAKQRPDDLELWLARGRYLVEQGRNAEADEAFAAAANLTPKELHRFLDGGWWAAGPFPASVEQPMPPEKFADPSKPVAVASGPGEYPWQPVPFAAATGRVEVAQVLNLAPTDSAYALSHVFSPDDRVTTLTLLASGPTRVWVNGRLVYAGRPPQEPAWADWAPPVPVSLRKGRNELLVRVAGFGTRVPVFHARLGDHPAERGVRLAHAGLWAEAEAEYAQACRRAPDDILLWRLHALLLWASGKQAEARDELNRRLRQYQTTTQWWTAFDILHVAALMPEERPAEARMADVVKAYLDGNPDRPVWLLHGAGTVCLGVGKWDTAAKLLEESRAKSDDSFIWPALALAYHHLGERDKAVDLVRKSEEWWARTLSNKLERANLQLPWSGGGTVPFLAHLDQARTALKIKAGPAPDFADLQASHRKMLAALDPATAPYDELLMRSPNDPLHWVALGQRQGERGRWDEARKAFEKATGLAPNDPKVWKARAQAWSALGKWDEAAADFVKAIELVPGQVSYGRDEQGVQSAAAAQDEVFARVIKALPRDAGLWARRFRRLAEAGEWKRAADTLDDARESSLADDVEAGFFRACLAAYLGDAVGYRNRCRTLLRRATGGDDLRVALPTAAACLLLPDAVPDVGRVLPLAERVVTGTEKHPSRTSFVQIRALAAYRTGDFDGTVTWLLRSPETSDGSGGVAWKALRAMAEHRLGKNDSARDWLEKARTAFANRPRPERGQSLDPWESWLVGELLLREAEGLIEGKQAGPGPEKEVGRAPCVGPIRAK